MLISICIPQYNRAEYLMKVLDTILEQTYKNIEVIISDDCSTDETHRVIPDYIKKASTSGSPIKFNYIRQPKNIGYDANLRASLEGGTGEYLFILGNDDGLSSNDAIQKLANHLSENNYPEVSFCNYLEYGVENSTQTRTNYTGVFGEGPEVAIEMFRCFSFVAGIAYKKDWFQRFNTNQFDGTVYFQIYLSTKIIASGGRVSALIDPLIAKDIKIDSQRANSHMDILKSRNQTFHAEKGGLDRVFEVAYAGIKDHFDKNKLNGSIRKIYTQLYLFTYPFWLYAYRKEGVYKASVNLAIGCRPTILITENLSLTNACHSWLLYFFVTFAGLCLPVSSIDRFKLYFKRLSKQYTFKSTNIN